MRNIQTLLQETPFREILTEFKELRIDPYLKSLQSGKKKDKGTILPFVRGLRFSARLIYVMRNILSASDLKVSWGHLIIDDGHKFSKECDIIIHKKGFKAKWNGHKSPIMNFKFINIERVIGVISCKSFIKPYSSHSNLDKEFYNSISKNMDKVWIFSECCNEKDIERIKNKAKEIGYKDFWCLYTWSDSEGIKEQPLMWNKFIKTMEDLSI